jgi:hypothetical protein
MNAPSTVSNRLIPAANSTGRTRIAYQGRATAAAPPAMTSSVTSVAVSKPSPNSAEPHRQWPALAFPALGEQVAGGVVDRGDVVGVEGGSAAGRRDGRGRRRAHRFLSPQRPPTRPRPADQPRFHMCKSG